MRRLPAGFYPKFRAAWAMRRAGIGRWSTGARFGSVVERVVALAWEGRTNRAVFRPEKTVRTWRRRFPTYQEVWDAYVAYHRIAAFNASANGPGFRWQKHPSHTRVPSDSSSRTARTPHAGT